MNDIFHSGAEVRRDPKQPKRDKIKELACKVKRHVETPGVRRRYGSQGGYQLDNYYFCARCGRDLTAQRYGFGDPS